MHGGNRKYTKKLSNDKNLEDTGHIGGQYFSEIDAYRRVM
jgi:hypothetical protein